jgi:tetratricopeptide (TPR) repeat protein
MTASELIDAISTICGLAPADVELIRKWLNSVLYEARPAPHDSGAVEEFPFGRLVSSIRRPGLIPDSSREGFDLCRMIRERRGNCLEFSVIFVLLGKELEINVRPVRVPAHMFVRVEEPGVCQNIETMDLDASCPDEQFIVHRSITPEEIDRGIYLSCLSDEEMLSEVAHKVLHALLASGSKISRPNRQLLRRAVNQQANGSDLLNSIGMNYCVRGRYYLAASWFKRSLERHAHCASALSNLIACQLRQQLYWEAQRTAQQYEASRWLDVPMAIVARPGTSELLLNLGRTHLRVGDYVSAERVFQAIAKYDGFGIWPSGELQQSAAAYMSCLSYLTGDYEQSSVAALKWYSFGPRNQLGAIWAASAQRRGGDLQKAVQIIDDANFTSPFIRGLAGLLCANAPSDELVRQFPERRGEIYAYLGECWAAQDIRRANAYWQMSLPSLAPHTFEHLRAFRSLVDQGETPAQQQAPASCEQVVGA